MAEKLKIIPLGGLNEIGKNLTVYEYGNDIIIVDVGMGFPDDDMYGVDVVIPDVSYLIKHQDKIRGIFLTHGHEDHIGALPYLLQDLNPNVPIYSSKLTLGMIAGRLEEHRIKNPNFKEVKSGDRVQLGKLGVALGNFLRQLLSRGVFLLNELSVALRLRLLQGGSRARALKLQRLLTLALDGLHALIQVARELRIAHLFDDVCIAGRINLKDFAAMRALDFVHGSPLADLLAQTAYRPKRTRAYLMAQMATVTPPHITATSGG